MIISEEDIRAVLRQGEDAVVALFLSIVGQQKVLFERIAHLEDKLAKDSNNSSKPPRSDGYKKMSLEPLTTSLRKKTGKKVDGQPGHKGATLEQVAKPDRIVVHRAQCCPDCKTNLRDAAPVADGVCRRQVFKIPKPRVFVTEHHALSVACPCCGKCCRGSFPQGVTQPVQYGPHLLGFATYLHGVHLVPFGRCAKIVQELTGAPISPGSLDRALQVVHKRLEPFEERLKYALARVSLKHADETGLRAQGKLNWFHTRCTARLSHSSASTLETAF